MKSELQKEKDREYAREYQRKVRAENPQGYNAKQREYKRNRAKNDPDYKARLSQKHKEWREKSTEHRRKYAREYMRHRRAKLTEQFMQEAKPNSCPMCGRSDTKICFDHCHATGKARGWLCSKCNSILGYASDSPELLYKLADYLISHLA